MSGIYDELDDVIPENVDDGTYFATCIQSSIEESSKDDRVWWILKWEIDRSHEDFPGEEITEMYQMFNKLSPEEFKALPVKDQKDVKFKRQLRKDRLRSLGVPEEQLNNYDDVGNFEGFESYITVKTTPSKDGQRMFTKVSKLELADTVNEEERESDFSLA